LKFSKAKTDLLAKVSGPKDELADALELIRDRATTNGNQPIRNWTAYLKKCLSEFLDSDWNTVRTRLARAAKAAGLSSPEAKAKAALLQKTAHDHDWTDQEFAALLRYDFGVHTVSVSAIAQLSEWDYQTALARVQQPPPSVCPECGGRNCEHQRAERQRFTEELRRTLAKL
jgi:hypothetical protein